MTYGPKVYREQGGNRLVVATGGDLQVQDPRGVLFGAVGFRIHEEPLTAAAGAGGIFAIPNPVGANAIVRRVILYITTGAGSAGKISVGVAAAAASSVSNLMAKAGATGTAPIVRDNSILATGTAQARAWPASGYLTGTLASGAIGSLAGKVFIEYQTV